MLLVLCLPAGSCRKDIYYDDNTYESVNVHVSWPDTITPPEGMRAIFYPADGSDARVFNISPNGGSVRVPSGDYDVFLFNNDTEYIRLQNTGSLSTIEAYTSLLLKAGKTKGFPEQNIVNMPDLFYACLLENVRISSETSSSGATIEAEPEVRVFNIEVLVKIIGIENVSAAIGYLSGVAGSYFPGKDSIPETSSAIAFDFGKKDSEHISAAVRTFGVSGTQPQENIFRLYLTLINGENMTCDFNITDQMKVDLKANVVVISIPDPIVVDNVSENTGSGFGAIVDDWDEVGVDIPM